MTQQEFNLAYESGYKQGIETGLNIASDATLNKISAEIKAMFQHETQDDYWDGYESCRNDVLKIIEKYTKGNNK